MAAIFCFSQCANANKPINLYFSICRCVENRFPAETTNVKTSVTDLDSVDRVQGLGTGRVPVAKAGLKTFPARWTLPPAAALAENPSPAKCTAAWKGATRKTVEM